MKINQLQFNKDVFRSDLLPLPNTDALRQINDETDLNIYKLQHGNNNVIIDRSKPCTKVFVVDAFIESRTNYIKGKAETLRKWNTNI